MDDVGLLEVAAVGDIDTRVGNVDLEEVLAFEVEMQEYAQSFPKECPLGFPRMTYRRYRYLVGLLVAHEHACFHAVVVQGVHQAVGGYSGTACLL